MNTRETSRWIDENGVIAIKADMTQRPSPEPEKLLEELGNTGKGIPFYAVYPADGSEPIAFGGVVFTSSQKILDVLERAGPSRPQAAQTSTAMND